jgi:hypothetical protein
MIAKRWILAQFCHRGTPLLFGEPGRTCFKSKSSPRSGTLLWRSGFEPLRYQIVGMSTNVDNFVAANIEYE